MDDYSINTLSESKNELCARLVNIFTPSLIQGLNSIFKDALDICRENEEEDKYLVTFQTYLSRIPQWNSTIIERECKRIQDNSGCKYLTDLITCVHIIQLKALTCVRVSNQQKKVDIDIPSLEKFVHNVYINVARKVYTNVYLFENDIPPLQVQKHNRELELIISKCILDTIRDTMPLEDILKSYISETEDKEVVEEIIEKDVVESEAKHEKSETPIKRENSETPMKRELAVGSPTSEGKVIDTTTSASEEPKNLRDLGSKIIVSKSEPNNSPLKTPHGITDIPDSQLFQENKSETFNEPVRLPLSDKPVTPVKLDTIELDIETL